MKSFITALLLTGVLAVSATTASFAQQGCVQQYDSSGAPTAPYCR
jgi:hypothetical protein